MKKLLIAAFAMALCTGLQAQDTTVRKKKMDHDMSMKKDCVVMKGGKMMMWTNGKSTEMDKEMTLTNGTVVMTDGTVKAPDGKTWMLTEGEGLYMDGTMKKKMKTEAPEKM